MKTALISIIFNLLVSTFVSAQLPVLDFKNLIGQKLVVNKHSVVPLQGSADGEEFSYTMYDSTSYKAVFDTIRRITDSTFLVDLRISDYKKLVYSDNELLVKDSIMNYRLSYVLSNNGTYKDIYIEERIAVLEGFFKLSMALTFDELDIYQHDNPILRNYRRGSRYRNLQDVKEKVFQELHWLHLFSGLTPRTESTCNSTQAVWLDLNMNRTPSILKYERKGNDIHVHQDIDYVTLYRGKVTEEDLKTIAASKPEDFFFRISSDAVYAWDNKRNIPKSINATLNTTIKNGGEEMTKTDSYNIRFIR